MMMIYEKCENVKICVRIYPLISIFQMSSKCLTFADANSSTSVKKKNCMYVCSYAHCLCLQNIWLNRRKKYVCMHVYKLKTIVATQLQQ